MGFVMIGRFVAAILSIILLAAPAAAQVGGLLSCCTGGGGPAPTAPDAPIISLTLASERGASQSDNVTNLAQPGVNVDLPFDLVAGDGFKLFVNSVQNGPTHTFTSPEIASGHFNLATTPLADGTYSFTGKMTRSGVDSAPSNILGVTISTAARGPPVLTLVGGGTTTTNLSPSIRATFSNSPAPQVGDYVIILDSAGNYYTQALLGGGDLTSKDLPLGNIGLGPGVPSVRTFSSYLLTAANTLSAQGASFTFSIVPATLTISGTPVTTATVNTTYAGFTVAGGGGYAPYTYTLGAGSWPLGISMDPTSGAVSGSPSAGGTYAGITIRNTDSAAPPTHVDLAPFTLVVSGATQQWSLSDRSAPQVLVSTTAFTNDTATMGAGAPFGGNGLRAVNPISTGTKKYYEINVVDPLNPSNQYSVALLTLAANLFGGYADAGTGFAYYDNGAFSGNGVFLVAAQAFTGGDKVGVAVDRSNNKVWMRKIAGGTSCQNWNNVPSDNPATNTGGFSISFFSTTDIYPAARFFSGFTMSSIMNIGGSAYACAAPAGFGNM